jgi:hypothetical protein
MKKISIMLIITLFIFIIGCGSLAVKPTQNEFTSADFGIYPDDYESIAKAYFAKTLFDPYSAVYTFSEPVKGKFPTKPRYAWAVCGTVNAKNRFGGYVGVMPFVLKIHNGKVLNYENYLVAESVCETLNK